MIFLFFFIFEHPSRPSITEKWTNQPKKEIFENCYCLFILQSYFCLIMMKKNYIFSPQTNRQISLKEFKWINELKFMNYECCNTTFQYLCIYTYIYIIHSLFLLICIEVFIFIFSHFWNVELLLLLFILTFYLHLLLILDNLLYE